MKKMIFIFIFAFSNPSDSSAFTLAASGLKKGWAKKELVFDVNESSCTALGISAGDLNAAIDAAINLWNSAPTSALKLKRGVTVTTTALSDPPVIYCDTAITSPDSVAGVGGFSTTGDHPELGRIELNGDSARSAYFGSLNATQQAIILAHEMGHVLGLGHSEKQYALMYYDISSKKNLTLSQDDVDGITWLNPVSEPGDTIFGCGTISSTPPGGGSFGNGNGILVLAVLLAFAYGVSRPRRAFFR